jgi:hypothetical protein
MNNFVGKDLMRAIGWKIMMLQKSPPVGGPGCARTKTGKHVFLKKEAKILARLSPTTRRQPCNGFLVLFFQKRTAAFTPKTDPAATSCNTPRRRTK